MLPKTLFVIRHGESAANLDHSLRATVPDHKIPLSSFGQEQCLLLGKHLAGVLSGQLAIWTSPYARARQTTALFSQSLQNYALHGDPRLREQEWGNFYDSVQAEERRVMLEAHSRFFYRMPEGESGADVFDRLCSFTEMLARENTAPTVLLSTHGMTGTVALKQFLKLSVEEYEQSEWFVNCGYAHLELEGNRYRLVRDCRRGWA